MVYIRIKTDSVFVNKKIRTDFDGDVLFFSEVGTYLLISDKEHAVLLQ